jgi:hypothetical protein
LPEKLITFAIGNAQIYFKGHASTDLIAIHVLSQVRTRADRNQTPYYNLYSHLVYATKANDVRTVIINGRIVMLEKRLLTLEESVIKKDANAYRKKIIDSLKN